MDSFLCVTSYKETINIYSYIYRGERPWPSGYGVGLKTLGSWVRSPHMVRF